eukprot:COSAG01_NODE_7613_length_3127_cov_1.861625_2_plen_87_part_00
MWSAGIIEHVTLEPPSHQRHKYSLGHVLWIRRALEQRNRFHPSRCKQLKPPRQLRPRCLERDKATDTLLALMTPRRVDRRDRSPIV